MQKPYTITVGQLLDALKNYDKSDRLYFGNGDLSYSRAKPRGDDLISIEFNQLYEIIEDFETDSKV